ncbi:hypothetical protein NAC44_09820 [Allorhizobium sp. BGMRC 0089]|uniref:hypothetical protein n=1 Tax=Allorhizobium sonneratiae TaxID=2934936 RepID=UPI0020341609|nr:hypothetical protein [Allorhizobium sonneratiae]MCM2292620.1 hypothetical protein [Allorhizobium sonneratiae]
MALELPSPRNRSERLGCLATLGPFPAPLTRLAEYALCHPDVMAFESCTLIASAARVSPSTVSRLAAALGFGSVRDFRGIFQEELKRISRRHEPPELKNAEDRRSASFEMVAGDLISGGGGTKDWKVDSWLINKSRHLDGQA